MLEIALSEYMSTIQFYCSLKKISCKKFNDAGCILTYPVDVAVGDDASTDGVIVVVGEDSPSVVPTLSSNVPVILSNLACLAWN